jgi:hypothetical protein
MPSGCAPCQHRDLDELRERTRTRRHLSTRRSRIQRRTGRDEKQQCWRRTVQRPSSARMQRPSPARRKAAQRAAPEVSCGHALRRPNPSSAGPGGAGVRAPGGARRRPRRSVSDRRLDRAQRPGAPPGRPATSFSPDAQHRSRPSVAARGRRTNRRDHSARIAPNAVRIGDAACAEPRSSPVSAQSTSPKIGRFGTRTRR